MIERDMMMHPGMSMNMPVQASHLAVGIVLHLAFSMLVGAIFIMILFALRRAGLSVLRTAHRILRIWCRRPTCGLTPRSIPIAVGTRGHG